MARNFNGTTDDIILALGGVGSWSGFTIAGIVYPTDVGTQRTLWSVDVGGSGRLEFGHQSSGVLRCVVSGAGKTGTTTLVNNKWYIIAVTKPTGTSTVRFHIYDIAAGTWVHEDSTTSADPAASSTQQAIGINSAGSALWQGEIEAVGVWNIGTTTDQQIESLIGGLNLWHQIANPVSLYVLNQGITTQKVRDLTGNGGNETTLNGTAVSNLSVPVWNIGAQIYEITGVAGVIYTKAGGAISASTGGGVKLKTSVKTGGATSPCTGGGANITTYNRAGGAISPSTGGGADIVTYNKTGGGQESGTTNYFPNGGAETNANNWNPNGSSTVTRITSDFFWGAACIRAVCNGVGSAEGCSGDTGVGMSLLGSLGKITGSAWVKGSIAVPMRMWLRVHYTDATTDDFQTTGQGERNWNLSVGTWQRISCTSVPNASKTVDQVELMIRSNGSVGAYTLYVDNLQVERKDFASSYVDTNGARASRTDGGASGGGAKTISKFKTGGAISPATGGGAKQQTLNRTGGAVSPATGGGADVVTYNRSGGAISPCTGSGANVTTYNRTGGAISPATGGGSKFKTSTKTGGAISPCTGGGADVLNISKTGGGKSPSTGGGADTITYNRRGGAISPCTGGGAKVKSVNKTGGGISPAGGGGTYTISVAPPPGVLITYEFAAHEVDITYTRLNIERSVITSYVVGTSVDFNTADPERVRIDTEEVSIVEEIVTDNVKMPSSSYATFEEVTN